MAPSIPALLDLSNAMDKPYDRISHRKSKLPIAIVPPDPSWPSSFAVFKKRIQTALGSTGTAVSIEHIGSTSVPGLPAKTLIDIDLTVKDIEDEGSYVPALEAAGFQLLLREREWFEHRLFCAYEPMVANLHVWPVDSPEAARHNIFRDWLLEHEEDRVKYATVKRDAAEASTRLGEDVNQYSARKASVINEILQKAFRALGYL